MTTQSKPSCTGTVPTSYRPLPHFLSIFLGWVIRYAENMICYFFLERIWKKSTSGVLVHQTELSELHKHIATIQLDIGCVVNRPNGGVVLGCVALHDTDVVPIL